MTKLWIGFVSPSRAPGERLPAMRTDRPRHLSEMISQARQPTRRHAKSWPANCCGRCRSPVHPVTTRSARAFLAPATRGKGRAPAGLLLGKECEPSPSAGAPVAVGQTRKKSPPLIHSTSLFRAQTCRAGKAQPGQNIVRELDYWIRKPSVPPRAPMQLPEICLHHQQMS